MNFDYHSGKNPLSSLNAYNDNSGIELIKALEEKYSLENDMIKAVSQGNYKTLSKIVTAEQFFENIEKRTNDPIRNMKNYLIILNTLMRKGVELGNVHPYYIHGMSSDFAIRIENSHTVKDIEKLWDEMLFSYCELVKKHSAKGYSPLIQHIVMMIDADPCGNLTLDALSKQFNVNPSYLSALFKKDTSKTLTEYVCEKRIAKARHLLETTSLRIQQISQECGIADVNYFTKLFKKISGLSPKQYRETYKLI